MVSDSLLFHADFRRLWLGNAVSQLGTMVTGVALPLLAVRTLHATPFEVGLLTTFEYLAFLVIGLPVGAWVDRVRCRGVMIVADVGRAVLLSSIPLAAAFGMLTIWQLYGVVLATGCLTVFFDVSYQSYLPFLVGRERLVEGNSKLQGAYSVARVAGPGLGGLLVQLLTAPYVMLTDAVSYLWSALWVGAIRHTEQRPERAARASLLHEIKEGLTFVGRHRLLRPIASCTATANLWNGAQQPMLIVLLARELHLSAGMIGAVLSTGACGGILGALTARRLARTLGEGPAIWVSLGVTAPLTLVQPFLHRGLLLGLFVGTQIAVGAGTVIYNVTQVSFRQALCPSRLRGRMNATLRWLVWGTMPLGGLLGGTLGATVGVRAALLVAAMGSTVSFLWVFCSPLRWMRELPTTPQGAQA
jgi:Transmembrane secretion effector